MSSTSPFNRFAPDRLRHSLLSQGGAQLFKLAVAIGIGGWMARYLGPQNFGTLSYVTALVGVLGPLGNLGVKGSLSAMLCEEQPLPGLLGSALLIELAGTLVIALVLIPFAWAARDPVIVGLIGLAVVGNLLSSTEVFEVDLLNRQRGTQLARVGTIQTLAGAIFLALSLLVQAPLLVFGCLPVIQSSIRGWLLAVAVPAVEPLQLLRQASWKTSRALIQRGWPLLFEGLFVMLYMKSDQVMLEWLRGPEDVGQYSVAVKVIDSLYFLPVILSNTFLPRIGRGTREFQTDPALRQLYRSAWLLGMGITVTCMFLVPPLIPLVFGHQFLPAQAALIWLSPVALFVSMGCASSAWLNILGQQKFMANRTLVGALVNVALNFFLIPRLGFVGAAISTNISWFIVVYLCVCFNKKASSSILYLFFPFKARIS